MSGWALTHPYLFLTVSIQDVDFWKSWNFDAGRTTEMSPMSGPSHGNERWSRPRAGRRQRPVTLSHRWPKSTNIGKTLPPEPCESPPVYTAGFPLLR